MKWGLIEAVERIQWALREVLPQLPESLTQAPRATAQTPIWQSRTDRVGT